MAISSANFQKAKSNSVAETTREFEAKYLLPKEHRGENEFYNCGTDEKNLFNQEVAKSERKGGRIPKLENSLWEGVINLNKKHTIEDVNRVGEHIAKKFNLHYTRGALHRDEGHIDENGKVQHNYHAHINFMTYKDGKQNWRLEFVNKEALRELQTEVAELLGMDRGELNSKSVRANHRHFRVNAEEIKAERIAVKEVLATKDQLKTANNQLREFMKSNGANRNDYAELEKEKKHLEEQLKAKLLTEKELLTKFQTLEKNFVSSKSLINELKTEKEVLASKVTDLEDKINSRANMTAPQPPKDIQEEFNKIKKEELEEKEVKTGLFSSEKIKVLKSDSNILQRTWNIVSAKYNDLKTKYNDLVVKFNILQKENLELKEKVKQLESEAPNQQNKKGLDYLNKFVKDLEIGTGSKSDSSNLEEKKEVQELQKEEKSNTKKKGYSNSR